MFDNLSEKFSDAFKTLQGKSRLSEDNIEEAMAMVRKALLEADVNFKVVKSFTAAVKEKALGEKVLSGVNPSEQFIKIVQDELGAVMGVESEEVDWEKPGLKVVLVVGLNGQGKTTFSGKLALYLKKQKNKKVLLVPADTFRPAAKDQLKTLAAQVEVDLFDSDLSLSPADLATQGYLHAKREGYDVVIIDTAGRLHVDQELMQELKAAKKSLESYHPEVLLVADAMTGQEAVGVAKTFQEQVGLTGIVLSKMDSDAKGGAALSIRHATGVPLTYISTGEKMKDLELFHPDRMAKRILDMGDVVSLVEKAQSEIEEEEAMSLMKNLEKGKFSVEDFMKQMEMVSRLGPMTSILKMLPGMGGALREIGDLSPAENEMKRMKVIIGSMTKDERKNYKLVNESRMNRIAKGSGNPVSAVKDFLAKFKQMEQMMGQMSSLMKGGFPMGMPGGMPGSRGGKGGQDLLGQGKKKKGGGGKGPWGRKYF